MARPPRKEMPDLKYLYKTFIFCHDSGRVFNRHTRSPNAKIGEEAGFNQRGYRIVRINSKNFGIHRIVWFIHYGSIPDDMDIDHVNGDPMNNRITNLRMVAHCDNQRNMKVPRTNTSGVVGVYWVDNRKRWVAYIDDNGQRKMIGRFKAFEAAVTARMNAEKAYGFHPNHGRLKSPMDLPEPHWSSHRALARKTTCAAP